MNYAKGTDFEGPTTIDGFDIIFKTSKATQIKRDIKDGEAIDQYLEYYTYMVEPQRTGTHTIPPATIRIGEKTLTFDPLTIEVLPQRNNTQNDVSAAEPKKEKKINSQH